MKGDIMSVIKKRNTIIGPGKAIVVPYIKSHADDPYIVNKANEAREFIEKHGFPDEKILNHVR